MSATPAPPPLPPATIRLIADKVYRLWLRDLQRETERQRWHNRRCPRRMR